MVTLVVIDSLLNNPRDSMQTSSAESLGPNAFTDNFDLQYIHVASSSQASSSSSSTHHNINVNPNFDFYLQGSQQHTPLSDYMISRPPQAFNRAEVGAHGFYFCGEPPHLSPICMINPASARLGGGEHLDQIRESVPVRENQEQVLSAPDPQKTGNTYRS